MNKVEKLREQMLDMLYKLTEDAFQDVKHLVLAHKHESYDILLDKVICLLRDEYGFKKSSKSITKGESATLRIIIEECKRTKECDSNDEDDVFNSFAAEFRIRELLGYLDE